VDTRTRIVRSAGKRGKTKAELADAVGVSYSQVAKLANELLAAGELQIVSRTDTGADIFAKAKEPKALSSRK